MHARDLDLFCDSYANGALRGACSLGFDLAPPDLAGPPRSTQERTCEIWNGDFWCNRHCKRSHVVLDGFGGQVWPKIGREPPPSSAKTRPGFVQALVLATGGSLQAYVLAQIPVASASACTSPPRSGISTIQLHVEKHKKVAKAKITFWDPKTKRKPKFQLVQIENLVFYLFLDPRM